MIHGNLYITVTAEEYRPAFYPPQHSLHFSLFLSQVGVLTFWSPVRYPASILSTSSSLRKSSYWLNIRNAFLIYTLCQNKPRKKETSEPTWKKANWAGLDKEIQIKIIINFKHTNAYTIFNWPIKLPPCKLYQSNIQAFSKTPPTIQVWSTTVVI